MLGLSGEVGSLETGKRADVILLDTPAAHVPYRFARNPVCAVFVARPPRVGAAGQRVAPGGRRRVTAARRRASRRWSTRTRTPSSATCAGSPSGPATPDDDFWSWRTEMFRLAGALEPDTMRDVAGRVYAEMAAAGYGAVGEFHYVHHRPDGTPYETPNAMAIAVAEAAVAAGLRIVLLPAAYHRNGWDGADRPPQPGQRRFCDPDVETFLHRVDDLRAWAAGPRRRRRSASPRTASAPSRRRGSRRSAPTPASTTSSCHVHAHEQRRELAECDAEHGCTPIELLARTGFLGERTSVVHGIHVTDADVDLLARSGAIVVSCPTTEGNLGDGFLPALRYRDAGVRLAIGSDSQVRVDPFEEVRELETGARREGQTRHALLAATRDLWGELVANGCAALGLTDAGTVAVDLDHPDLRGVAEADLPYALATCASAGVVARAA